MTFARRSTVSPFGPPSITMALGALLLAWALLLSGCAADLPLEDASPPKRALASVEEAVPDEPDSAGETAQLVVRSNVTADTVYVDDFPVGPSGTAAHAITAGEHAVRVEKDGYWPFETRVQLAPGARQTVRAKLARIEDEIAAWNPSPSHGAGLGPHGVEPAGDLGGGDLGGVEAPAGITFDQYRSGSGYFVKFPNSIGFEPVGGVALASSDEAVLSPENVRFSPGGVYRTPTLAISSLDPNASGEVALTVMGVDREGAGIAHAFQVTVDHGAVQAIQYLGEADGIIPEEGPAPPSTVISRYPTVESPDQVPMAEQFEVRVSLTKGSVTPEVVIETVNEEAAQITSEGGIAMRLPLESPDQAEWDIDVTLSAPGFQYLDSGQSSLKLRKVGDSTPAVFRLRADSIPVPRRTRKLFVTFYHENAYLAEVTREIQVVNPEMPVSPAFAATVHAGDQGGRQRAKKRPVVFRMSGSLDARHLSKSTGPRQPDLTVSILSGENVDNRHQTEITIRSPYLEASTLTLKDRYTQRELAKWLRGKYTKLFHETRKSGDTHAAMRSLGRGLYKHYAPAAFKKAFWELVDKRGASFQSIQIVTNQPRLPWELMIPSRPGGPEGHDFLGMRYRVARWHRPLAAPPQSLPLADIAVIAPQYRGGDKLPWRKKELDVLKGMPGYRGVSGRYDDIKNFFGHWPPGVVHFAGHGSIKKYTGGVRGYTIKLEDKELDLDIWKGLPSGDTQTHPFFFFNACQVGRSHRVAHMVDGWAPAVLEAGASGYIGALWSVGDKGAADFGIRFYRSLEKQLKKNATVTVSDVLRQTRKRFRETGDPTYLSYIFYGDPNFRFVR